MLNLWMPKLAIFRQRSFECFESFQNKMEETLKTEDGMNFSNKERESFKKRLQEMQNQLVQLKDEKLYMEGLPAELGMDDADELERKAELL